MEDRIAKIEEEIQAIKERNFRVEREKAWETSNTRAWSIIIITYVVVVIVMRFLSVNDYLLNAVVPTLGFFLSIQSLPIIRKWWIKRHYR